MSQKYETLKTLPKELFQLDEPDLDFGLYRQPSEAIATGWYRVISKSSPRAARGTADGGGEQRSQFRQSHSKSSTMCSSSCRNWEKQQHPQPQDIFRVEDEIVAKRDRLVDQLERGLAQRTEVETLFTIPWAVQK